MMQDMKRSYHTLAMAVLTMLVLVAGCRGPQPIPCNVQVQLPDEEAYRQFWSHSVNSVRHFGYELDRVDPAAGVITSEPLTSKQWFEFWRNDTLGADQVGEASLHTMRRAVRVEVQPTLQDKNEYVVSVRVNVERISQIERQVTVTSAGAQTMTGKLPPVQQAGSPAEAQPHWVDLGRDRTLEAAILQQICHYPDARIIPVSDNQGATGTLPSTQPSQDESRELPATSEPAP